MTDEQIDIIESFLKKQTDCGQKRQSVQLYWIGHGKCLKCACFIRDWHEIFYDGSVCEIGEPAVNLEDGSFVSLWNSEIEEFKVLGNF